MPDHALTHGFSVALGGALGASLRYVVALLLPVVAGKPHWAILIVNIVGCFAAGLISTLLASKAPANTALQLFLITGMLGGFTTFSAFSLDTVRLASEGYSLQALLNMAFNLLGSVLAAATGWYFARALL